MVSPHLCSLSPERLAFLSRDPSSARSSSRCRPPRNAGQDVRRHLGPWRDLLLLEGHVPGLLEENVKNAWCRSSDAPRSRVASSRSSAGSRSPWRDSNLERARAPSLPALFRRDPVRSRQASGVLCHLRALRDRTPAASKDQCRDYLVNGDKHKPSASPHAAGRHPETTEEPDRSRAFFCPLPLPLQLPLPVRSDPTPGPHCSRKSEIFVAGIICTWRA